MIPYGRQSIGQDDIEAVADVLKSDWLTTGPKVTEFEQAFADYVGARHAVAVSSGTAALHAAMYALGIGPGDEVIVPPMTFAATANCVVYQGGTPVFADVCGDTLLLDPDMVEERITARTKAIIAVDYGGQPCEYDRLGDIAAGHGLALVADGCHALGARYKGSKVGTLADMTVFSFHPVKHITTGEGGMITTDSKEYAAMARRFRNHGITSDHHDRQAKGSWFYEMVDLGFNYRLTDFQCALGLAQLGRLPDWLAKRRSIAQAYGRALERMEGISPLRVGRDAAHAYHLYVVDIDERTAGKDRDQVFMAMRERGVSVNVHYVPVHLHPFYVKRFGTRQGICPVTENAYRRILSLPIYPALEEKDQAYVIGALREVLA